ncbi:tetratricopeptide repeat protein [Desulfurobacterium sp.]
MNLLKKLLATTVITISLFTASSAMTYNEIKLAYHKSFTYEKARDYRDAIKALMPVYQAYPKGYTVNLRLGWLYYLMGKYKNSEVHYQKAIEAIPSSIEARLGLSLPLMAEKRWQDVESLMYKVLKTDYYNFYGNLRLAIALRNEGKAKLAEQVSRKMLAVYPSNVAFLTELGLDLFAEGKKKEAYAVFKDVLILDPENTTAKYYLGIKK